MTGRDVFLPFARRFRLVLAASNQLSERVDDGSFGETLFYKISSLSLTVPSLREMRGDIATNAAHLLAQLGESGSAHASLTPAAAEWLEAQEWPGNYAQLARTLQVAAHRAPGSDLSVIALEHALQYGESPPADGRPLPVAAAVASPAGGDSGETRPPFPMASDRAREAALAAPTASAPSGPILTARSLFRPSSIAYNFSARLAESLAAAEAVGAG